MLIIISLRVLLENKDNIVICLVKKHLILASVVQTSDRAIYPPDEALSWEYVLGKLIIKLSIG